MPFRDRVASALRSAPALDRLAREALAAAGLRPAPLVDAPGPRATRERALADYARLPIDQLVAFAYAARSVAARDVIEAASRRRGLSRSARSGLAEVLVQQGIDPADGVRAAALYEQLQPLQGAEFEHFANTLLDQGRVARAAEVVAAWNSDSLAHDTASADLLNPFVPGGDPADLGAWLEAFNRVFTRAGLEPATLAPDDGVSTPFDRLRSTATDEVHGPLVTIIMSCFRPGRELIASLISLTEQTWRDLEIIVTDDASPAGYEQLFAEAEALDPRIRVLRNADNRGTYIRRNEAIAIARGEFVTVHDSDDWAHPRRIELQVQWMLDHPDAPGSVCTCVRATPELRYHQYRGPGPRICEPAILFRPRLTETVGWFDPVRKSADGEFRRRVDAAMERGVEVHWDLPPLTIQRQDETSLSGAEIRPHWISEARTVYISNYTSWHHRIAAGTDSPLLDPSGVRRYPAPTPISGEPRVARTFDTILLLDAVLRADDTRDFGAVAADVRARVQRGEVVGVLHRWSLGPHQAATPQFHPKLQQLVDAGLLAQVLHDDPARAALGIVPEPSALQFRGIALPTVRFDRLVALTNGAAPHHPGGGIYVVDDCAATARRDFEADLEWLPSV